MALEAAAAEHRQWKKAERARSEGSAHRDTEERESIDDVHNITTRFIVTVFSSSFLSFLSLSQNNILV